MPEIESGQHEWPRNLERNLEATEPEHSMAFVIDDY